MLEIIKEFTNKHLIFLLDKGVSSYFIVSSHYNEYTIILIFDDNVNLNWIDISDDIEPFIEVLNKTYKLDDQLIIQDIYGDSVDYKIKESFNINSYIKSIALWIRKEN